jgi:hypothetical protein
MSVTPERAMSTPAVPCVIASRIALRDTIDPEA